jgi:hypothetical protein
MVRRKEIDRLQAARIADNDQLMELERTRELVPIQESAAREPALQSDKYCRPWCNQFLQDMSGRITKISRAATGKFCGTHHGTTAKLRRHNGSAAPSRRARFPTWPDHR